MNILNTTGYELYNPNISKADNCILTDNEGKKYYDLEAGVWALPLGHNNVRVNQVILNQLNQVAHVGYRYSHPVVEEAAAALLDIMNFPDGKCVFLSSGSEAVEFAIKAVLKVMDKPYLLRLDKHYLSAYGISGNQDSDRWLTIDWQSNQEGDNSDYIELLRIIPFDQIGAFVFEPGNTSGTANLPPKDLVQAIAAKVREHRGLIVVDEVTTGMGRTGRWFGCEHYEIKPDLIACGKGLGNGYPVSAVGMKEGFAKALEESGFLYAQSHQNDPLGCAVAKEVIAIMKENSLVERAKEQGSYLRNELNRLSGKYPFIKKVKGIGLMNTLWFDESITKEWLFQLHKRLYEAGFIVGVRPVSNVLRFYPPLSIERSVLDAFVKELDLLLEN